MNIFRPKKLDGGYCTDRIRIFGIYGLDEGTINMKRHKNRSYNFICLFTTIALALTFAAVPAAPVFATESEDNATDSGSTGEKVVYTDEETVPISTMNKDDGIRTGRQRRRRKNGQTVGIRRKRTEKRRGKIK